jgi:hypothetical protein
MSQADLGTIDGAPGTGTPGTALASLLNAWRTAVHSGHSGASRPAYAVGSMTWVKTVSSTAHEIYYFDGTDDILLYTVDPTNNRVSITNVYDIYSNANNAVLNLTSSPPDGMSYDRTNSRLLLARSAGPAFQVSRHGSDGSITVWYRNGSIVGSINVTTTATTYATTSDHRAKYDVETIVNFELPTVDGPLGKLMKIRPVKYRMYADGGAEKHYGFIAHELQEHIPHAVTGFKDEVRDEIVTIGQAEDGTPITETQSVPVMQGVDYSGVVSLLTAALQQLTLRVIELEKERAS